MAEKHAGVSLEKHWFSSPGRDSLTTAGLGGVKWLVHNRQNGPSIGTTGRFMLSAGSIIDRRWRKGLHKRASQAHVLDYKDDGSPPKDGNEGFMTLTKKAALLKQLHHGETPLVLVNVWDAASARIIEHAGFPAIATGSAGVAFALGCPDGQHLEWPTMVEAIERIAHAVDVPVTADIEAGFSSDIATLERNVDEVMEAGAVGINLEDAISGDAKGMLYSIADQVARIQAARAAADRRRIHLVLNARTDAYWRNSLPPETALSNTIERARLYLNAGADCVFVPGLSDSGHIRRVVEACGGPVNILAGPGVPPIPDLSRLGVRRISMGSGPMRAALGTLRRIAHEAQTAGTYNALLENTISSAEMNALLARVPQTEIRKPA